MIKPTLMLTDVLDSTHQQSIAAITQIRRRTARWRRYIQAFELSPMPKGWR